MKISLQAINEKIWNQELYSNTHLGMNDVCSILEITPRRMRSILRTSKGQNFTAYINEIRIRRFLELMRSGEISHLSIWGLAQEVGFQSKSSFYAAFRKITNTTPTRYEILFQKLA